MPKRPDPTLLAARRRIVAAMIVVAIVGTLAAMVLSIADRRTPDRNGSASAPASRPTTGATR